VAQIVRFPRPSRAADFDAELEVAVEAARRAGRLQMEHYERLERIVHKSEHDVVTEVDTLSEQLIIDAIRDVYPDDAFLAEESGHSVTVGPPSERKWIIDPLDGTVNYANGIPVFCVSVGLTVGERPVVGVVYDPTRDELFSARIGGGAHLDGVPIRHPAKPKLSDCVVSLSLGGRGWATRARNVRRRIRVSRSMGSAALAIAYLANGRFDAFVQVGGLSLWDICAGGLIAIEAGVRLTALDGGEWFDASRPAQSIGLLGASPAHHQALLDMLA
jgi:myo-inositol-1(or 4)-monophosphatase